MSVAGLTQNAIETLIKNNGTPADPSFQPVIQILKIMPVSKTSTAAGSERYRVILSDGNQSVQGMLATQHNYRVTSKQIIDLSLIRITEYMVNAVQNVTLAIVLKFDIVQHTSEKIGNPRKFGAVQPQGNVPQAAQPMYASSSGTGGNATNTVKAENVHSSNPYSPSGGNRPNPYGNSATMSNNNSYNNNSAPVQRMADPISNRLFTKIAALNMFQQRWTLKARVTNKGEVRTWSNSKGEGTLFSITILDSSDHDIKCTFFKEAVDKFEPLLEEDKVYTFSGGRLKAANRQYNTCKSQYEITFDQNSEIHLEEDTGEIVQQSFEFKPIAELESVEPGDYVDIIGVVKSVTESSIIMSKKTGKELCKAEMTIGDDSGADVTCTIWGEKAKTAQHDYADNPIVAARKARVSDFGGRTLSASNGGILKNPRVPDAQRIQLWWNNVGSAGGAPVKMLSARQGGASRFPVFEDRKTISAIKGENLGVSEKPDWISFKGTFSFIKSDKDGGAWYTACPNEGEPCKNRYKVTEQGDGSYECLKCNQTYQNCVRRFIFSATVSDDTSTTWVSIFDDQARVLFDGITADQVYTELNDQNGEQAYEKYFVKATNTEWVLTCKVKQEMNQDEMRTKTSIHSVHPMDYSKEGRSLFNNIIAMQQ